MGGGLWVTPQTPSPRLQHEGLSRVEGEGVALSLTQPVAGGGRRQCWGQEGRLACSAASLEPQGLGPHPPLAAGSQGAAARSSWVRQPCRVPLLAQQLPDDWCGPCPPLPCLFPVDRLATSRHCITPACGDCLCNVQGGEGAVGTVGPIRYRASWHHPGRGQSRWHLEVGVGTPEDSTPPPSPQAVCPAGGRGLPEGGDPAAAWVTRPWAARACHPSCLCCQPSWSPPQASPTPHPLSPTQPAPFLGGLTEPRHPRPGLAVLSQKCQLSLAGGGGVGTCRLADGALRSGSE